MYPNTNVSFLKIFLKGFLKGFSPQFDKVLLSHGLIHCIFQCSFHWHVINTYRKHIKSSIKGTEDSPKARYHATEQEQAVTLYEGRQEGKEAIHGHADKQTLSPTHFICHAPPEESPHHHPNVYDATYSIRKGAGKKREHVHKQRQEVRQENTQLKNNALEKCLSIKQKKYTARFIPFVHVFSLKNIFLLEHLFGERRILN